MKQFLHLITFSFVLLFSSSLFSQQLKTNAFFLELGGISPQYSINYEKIFAQNRSIALASRMGASFTRSTASIPVGISLITVPGIHHLQFTVGVTPFVDAYDSFTIQGSDTYLYLDSGLGYRFENSRIPFFGFVTANPLLKLDPTVDSLLGNNDEEFIFSVGVAFGYKW
ncbi:MAG: hypothetical protein KDE26_15015 [Bacteroidetes bacterium]|nr:hypothetical protein [Bacteroidota bacterium]MCB0844562.1 hypothetical protein [Bacteroidota bacterium]